MTVNLSALAGAGQQFFDNNGNPLSGGKLYSYQAGTTTNQTTYANASGSTAHTNPIVLDSAGRVPSGEIWLTAGQNYKFVLKTSTEVTIATWDNITGINGTGITSNAVSVEYDPPFTGALTSGYTVQDKLAQTISVADFGAVGDGVTDDTAAIQAALNNAGNIYIPPGIYIVTPLQMRDDTTLVFSPQTTLQAKVGYGASDRLLNIIGVSNITIHGNFGKVKMLSAEYTAGEDRHCVNMYGVENVTVYDLVTEDSGGDGFYVGATVCRNVQIINCVADNHRRNGLSITNASNMLVLGGHYKNTGSTSAAANGPCAGIDIESNLLDNYYLENINVIGVYTSGNIGCGILVTPQSKWAPVSINVENCTSFNDGSLDIVRGKGAIAVTAAMAYTPSTPASLIGKIEGKVNVTNCSIINPIGSGFTSVNWTENAPYTTVKNLFVQNPFSGTGSPSNRYKAGVFFRGETPSSGTYGTSIGNMSIEGVRVEDNRTVPLMYLPIYVETSDEATKPLKDLSITEIDVTAGQWTYASGLIPFAKAGTLAQTNVVLQYKNEFTAVNTVTTTSIGNNDVGLTRINSGNTNYVLPDAALYIGSTFNFFHSAAGNFQITPASSDSILQYSPDVGVGIISRYAGSTMAVKAVSATEWKVVEVSGGWAAGVGYEPRFQNTYNTAAPVSENWVRGDIIWNLNPSAGGKVGWVCVASGNPGTWKAFGVIDA
jgi:hypothetical protein